MRYDFLEKLGITNENRGAYCGDWLETSGAMVDIITPIDGSVIASVRQASADDYERVVAKAAEAFEEWRMVPAPTRGETVRQIGQAFREYKSELGALVTLEMGKIRAEGEGEVQEMIDMADFAVGQSRMLYGLTMQSERPRHRMMEQWHPLSVVGVISAFNFPVAVWSWNTFLALVCGDSTLWKPASKTPLTAIACMNIIHDVLRRTNCPEGIVSLVIGQGSEIGELLVNDPRIPLVSATGSTRMGKRAGCKGLRSSRSNHTGVGGEQRDRGDALGQSGSCSSGDTLRSGGHVGTALHDHAQDNSPRVGGRRIDRAACQRVQTGQDRRSAG